MQGVNSILTTDLIYFVNNTKICAVFCRYLCQKIAYEKKIELNEKLQSIPDQTAKIGTKIKKCRKSWKFWPYLKKNELLVFFGAVGPQDAMF